MKKKKNSKRPRNTNNNSNYTGEINYNTRPANKKIKCEKNDFKSNAFKKTVKGYKIRIDHNKIKRKVKKLKHREPVIFQLSSVDWSISKNTPIITFYGLTENEQSVACFIKGFYPFFYIEDPFILNMKSYRKKNIQIIQKVLSNEFKRYNNFDKTKSNFNFANNVTTSPIKSIEYVQKMNLYGYSKTKKWYMKITLFNPWDCWTFSRILKNGISIERFKRQFNNKAAAIKKELLKENDEIIREKKHKSNSKKISGKEDNLQSKLDVFFKKKSDVKKKLAGNNKRKKNIRNLVKHDLFAKFDCKNKIKSEGGNIISDEEIEDENSEDEDLSSSFNIKSKNSSLDNDNSYGQKRKYPPPDEGTKIFMMYFETNVDFELRFLSSNNISPFNWIRVSRYSKITSPIYKKTRCEIEISTDADSVVKENNELYKSSEVNKTHPDIANFRILSFDIECSSISGKFPHHSVDPIIQISNIVKVHRNKSIKTNVNENADKVDNYFVKNVFVLGNCEQLPGVNILCFNTEREMLIHWVNFFNTCDPDFITGYNISSFDLRYIYDRMRALGIGELFKISRITDQLSKYKKKTFESKQKGKYDNYIFKIPGRIIFDMYSIIRLDHITLSSYKLNDVSSEFLGEQKEDVKYSEIKGIYDSQDPQKIKDLARYCYKDALLPILLIDKLMKLYNYIEMSKLTSVLISNLINNGQQKKVHTLILKMGGREDYIIPSKIVYLWNKFQGARVFEPIPGYYIEKVLILDFASLYPNIMRAFNLCYSTWLNSEQKKNDLKRTNIGMNDEELWLDCQFGDSFVTKNVKLGLLPKILTKLLDTRAYVKKLMKRESDPFKKAVYDARQLALKLTANSTYGVTGAALGSISLIPISRSVTYLGRTLITKTQNFIETNYKGSKVIYGDTGKY